jgi:glycosyltransferase involved in cell wall biosynthesis
MKCSIILPTRNRRVMLMRALDALGAQRGAPEFEVVVIDNGSNDGTARALAERRDGFPLSIVHEPEPNRARARNAGLEVATGDIAVFIDDDVIVPPHFLAAHAAAHREPGPLTVTGPILNIPSSEDRPKPAWRHLSRAFFCTCNASLPLVEVRQAGRFDPAFTGYGWEDTELGVRLRDRGLKHRFAWNAYAYHVKPHAWERLDEAQRRMREKARMALVFLAKQPSMRVRLATGNYRANLLRAALLNPRRLRPCFAALADAPKLPYALRAFARSQYLDGIYLDELRNGGRG